MATPGAATIDVSACICTYNRKERLGDALASLAQVRLPAGVGFEVVVVDNNSSDGTAETVADATAEGFSYRYVMEPRQGLSHARNRAIAEARGRLIAFLDDDVVVEKDWLQKLVLAFSVEPMPAAVGGRALLDAERALPRWWHDDFAGPAGHFDRGDSVLRSDKGYRGMIGIGANLAFDRRVFDRYGEFRSDLGRTGTSLAMGEELELLERLRRGGETLVYDPSVVVRHRPDLVRLSRSYLRRWYFQFGEWRFVAEGESDVARVLGIPRWRLRHVVEEGARWFYALITRKPGAAFQHELELFVFAGYLNGQWQRRCAGREKQLREIRA
jgi:glycosyltransferase involved in cell wall biosynthesis